VTCVEDIQVAAKAVNDFLGPPTVLINNAGIAHAHTILNSTPQYLRKLFDINVISHYYLVQAFLPDMIKHKKGHIVTLASLASFVGPPGLIDYAASKAAVLAFHEGLHSELKHRYNAPFIKTTVVQPIYVRTALIESWQTSLKGTKALLIQPSTVARAIVDQIVSGRSGQICLPRWMGIAGSLIRAMPWWMQETIRDDMKNDARESAVGQKPGV
jgi:all-trans-retinol dehydrogenase (NAD+)